MAHLIKHAFQEVCIWYGFVQRRIYGFSQKCHLVHKFMDSMLMCILRMQNLWPFQSTIYTSKTFRAVGTDTNYIITQLIYAMYSLNKLYAENHSWIFRIENTHYAIRLPESSWKLTWIHYRCFSWSNMTIWQDTLPNDGYLTVWQLLARG